MMLKVKKGVSVFALIGFLLVLTAISGTAETVDRQIVTGYQYNLAKRNGDSLWVQGVSQFGHHSVQTEKEIEEIPAPVLLETTNFETYLSSLYWSRLAPENAVALAYSEYEGLAAAFTDIGVWTLYHGWTRLAPENAVDLTFAGDFNQFLVVAFEEIGVWLYDRTDATWHRLAPENAVALSGPFALFVAFEDIGVWQFFHGWTQIAPEKAVALEYGAANDILAVAFEDIGVWLYDGLSWSPIAPEKATALAFGGPYLFVAFEDIGVWLYNVNDGTWVQMVPYAAADLATHHHGALAVAFKDIGVWLYDRNFFTWHLLAPENAVSLTFIEKSGSGDYLAVAFKEIGVWKLYELR